MVLTEAEDGETSTTNFQIWDPKRGFRNREASGSWNPQSRHPRDSRHPGSWISNYWGNSRLRALDLSRGPQGKPAACPGVLAAGDSPARTRS